MKKEEKARNLGHNLAKKLVIWVCTQTLCCIHVTKLAIKEMREENAKKDAIRDAEMAKKDAEMTAM